MAEQSTQSITAAQSIIESKLTKTEAIELMVAETLCDLRRARTNLAAEIARLEQVTVEDIIGLLKGKRVKLDVWEDSSSRSEATLNMTIEGCNAKASKLEDPLKERVAKIRALSKQKRTIDESIHKLESDRQATKIGILKSILEGTPEGRAMLAQLDIIRHAAAKRLGVEVDVRLLAGKV